MKIVNVFGQLFLNASKKLMSLAERCGVKETGTESEVLSSVPNTKTLVWRVLDGPFCRYDFDEGDIADEELDDDFVYMLVVQIEEDGKLGTANFWYETEEEAMSIKKYFDSNIEPLEVN